MHEYARPGRVEDVLSLLTDVPGARLLTGGTDLLVGLRKGSIRTPLVVDLKRVADLPAGIEQRDGVIRIGARTVLTTLIEDRRINAAFPALVAAARVVGSIQIRNRATLAGNLCNASPAADTVPPLLVYGAAVELHGPDGPRRVPLDDFLTGPGRTVLRPAELVTAVDLPLPDGPRGSAFARMTRRRGVDLATVNLACLLGPGMPTRFAFGAVGPRAFTVEDETGRLADPDLPPKQREAILERMTAQATPISNVRASREYRQAMLRVLAGRALDAAQANLVAAR